jgi:hypothetical protein
MAKQRSTTSNLGVYVYGGAAIFLGLLGLLGLVSGDFATTWQNVGPHLPLRVPLPISPRSLPLRFPDIMRFSRPVSSQIEPALSLSLTEKSVNLFQRNTRPGRLHIVQSFLLPKNSCDDS